MGCILIVVTLPRIALRPTSSQPAFVRGRAVTCQFGGASRLLPTAALGGTKSSREFSFAGPGAAIYRSFRIQMLRTATLQGALSISMPIIPDSLLESFGLSSTRTDINCPFTICMIVPPRAMIRN